MSPGDQIRAKTIGRNVFIGLVVATAVEYGIAAARVPGLIGLVLTVALIKAWLIVIYFMHIGRLRGEGD